MNLRKNSMLSRMNRSFPALFVASLLTLLSLGQTSQAADPEKAKEAFNKGVAAKTEGKLADAALNFLQATSFDPDYFDAYLNLGTVYFEQKKFDEAMSAFKSASEKNAKSEDAFSNLGKVYARLERFTDAEGAFKSAIGINDKNPDHYRELAKVYYENNNNDQLIQTAKKCHELGGEDEITWFMLGKGMENKKQSADALAAYQKSAELKKNYNAYNAIGKFHLERKAFQEAADAFKAALAADGKKWRAAYNYASAMEFKDQSAVDDNIKNWENFVRIAKGDPKAAKDVATAQAHIGELKKAKEAAGAAAGTN